MFVLPVSNLNFGCKRVVSPEGTTQVIRTHPGCTGCPKGSLLKNLLLGGKESLPAAADTKQSPEGHQPAHKEGITVYTLA